MTAAYPAALSDDGDTDSECQLTPITGESQRRDSADEYPSDSVLDEESQPHPDIPVVSLSRGNKRLNADVVKLGSKGTSGLLASIGDILEQRATTVDSELRKIYEKADKDIGVLVQRTLERQRRRRDEEAARARSDMSNLKDRIGRKQEALTNAVDDLCTKLSTARRSAHLLTEDGSYERAVDAFLEGEEGKRHEDETFVKAKLSRRLESLRPPPDAMKNILNVLHRANASDC
eukprot:GHVU01098920.1.p1 GENE.GHVU01098920.1~~GHVU01098920.1.p1  ORF type:complete len:265 (-),score=51.71 GHVU01098920.1:100-798(-)